MNCSFFIIEQILDLNNNVCSLIKGIGEDLLGKRYMFYKFNNRKLMKIYQ